MTDAELETIYKGAIGVSRFAAMQALYTAGFADGLAATQVQPDPPVPEPVFVAPPPAAIQDAAAKPVAPVFSYFSGKTEDEPL